MPCFTGLSRRTSWIRRLAQDPRHLQITTLAGLVIYGTLGLDFEIRPVFAVVTVLVALSAQLVLTRLFRLPAFDPRSALVSSLSLTLLLRSNSLALIALAAAVSIASKFVLRWNDRHLFNPTCFGIVVMLAVSDRVWVSAGQWGQTAFFGFLLAGAGMLVVYRAARADVTVAFLVSYAGLLLARAAWLGDPLQIPLHHLQNGALLLFAFFMITDPKTTPHARLGRFLFASGIAVGALGVQFGLYENNGPLWSLAVMALSVPVLDRIFPGSPYTWPSRSPSHRATKGGSHAPQTIHPRPLSPPAGHRPVGLGFLRLLRR